MQKKLVGDIDDEDEEAILTRLEESKKRSASEFLQLVREETWELLDSSFNEQDIYDLEKLFPF